MAYGNSGSGSFREKAKTFAKKKAEGKATVRKVVAKKAAARKKGK